MKTLVTLTAILSLTWGAFAQEEGEEIALEETRFLQLSLSPGIALQTPETRIQGISLNIWGENPRNGFTLGFVNGSRGESGGLSLGLINYSETYHGVQWGLSNVSSELLVGWQDSFINIANELKGLQLGFVNVAEKASGVQFGFVNYAAQMNGVQIGGVNIIRENPWFKEFPGKLAKGFPLVNWSF